MNGKHFTVDHIRRTTDKPFGDVTRAFERQLGALRAGRVPGDCSGRGRRERKAIQYAVGNPLFAIQMTQHDIRASLYAPLRVLIYEDEEGKTCVEYDRPSSLFGHFGDDRISPTAAMLDRKLEALVSASFE